MSIFNEKPSSDEEDDDEDDMIFCNDLERNSFAHVETDRHIPFVPIIKMVQEVRQKQKETRAIPINQIETSAK